MADANQSANQTLGANVTDPNIMAVPVYAVGTNWTYATSASNYYSVATAELLAESMHSGDNVYVTRTVTVLPGNGVSMKTETIAWDRIEDLAKVASMSTTYVETPYGDHASQSQTRNDPPCRLIAWPIFVGKAWDATCTTTTTRDGSTRNQTVESQVTVREIANLTVSAGTFRVFHVEIAQGRTVTHEYYAAEACGLVKRVVSAEEGEVATELTNVRCEAAGTPGG